MIAESLSPADRLRAAWNETTGDPYLDELNREALAMHAEDIPSLAAVLADLRGESRTELDLHLADERSSEHETGAYWFGRFITRAANAVKEVSKELGGLRQLGANLQVLAPSPGSVRVVLRSPAPHRGTATLPETESETIEALAMRRIVALLRLAESDDPESPLEASVLELRGESRHAIALMAGAMVKGRWSIEGELRDPRHGSTSVRVNGESAGRLANVARVTDANTETNVPFDGLVDGWAWSTATMSFEPDFGPRFEAAVPDTLHPRVARLVDTRERVRGLFTVVTKYPAGDDTSPRHSYALTKIQTAVPLAEAQKLGDES